MPSFKHAYEVDPAIVQAPKAVEVTPADRLRINSWLRTGRRRGQATFDCIPSGVRSAATVEKDPEALGHGEECVQGHVTPARLYSRPAGAPKL